MSVRRWLSPKLFADLPLRRRLSLLIAVASALTATLSLLAVLGSSLWLQSERAREETTEVARTLAYALQAPVAFADLQGMTDSLNLLRARPQVSGAWVYDADGRLLAAYGVGMAPKPGAAGIVYDFGHLQATEPIRTEGGVIGQVVIVNGLSRLWQALGIAMLAIALASGASLLLSVRLAQRIAAAITQPIETLALTTRSIAEGHDYSQRLPVQGLDEISTATRAFNEMLDEIAKRGNTLVEANRQLEQRVEERTRSLQREKDRAESASLAKTRFLANMSHELRTPLNAVIGAAQLLQEGHDDAQGQATLIEAIRSSSLNLLGLIDNILDLARIETGAMALHKENFNLVECLESALTTAAVAARLKNLEIACIVDPDLAVWRHGDSMRLRQLLLNLLGNAVKFTLHGEVVVRADPGPGPDDLRISVRDTGIGIAKASLPLVFEPFRQADDASNRRFGGSGLGLAIVRQLVDVMGGRITLSSELGIGSRFEIELALPTVEAVERKPERLQNEVLFFEPHEASAEALGAHLQRLGCRATRCHSAQALGEWMQTRPRSAGRPWLLLALDAPESSAVLEQALRGQEPQCILGMTSSESLSADASRHRHELAGVLRKPLMSSALLSSFEARQAEVSTLPTGPRLPRQAGLDLQEGPLVLVVEDDPTNQMIVCAMLHNAGYHTQVAHNGEQALSLLAQQLFDVVLMDWQMPDLDGLEVTRRLRAGVSGGAAARVPIVALTANAFSEDRSACLAAGMNDFLSKPVLRSSLLATLERWTTPRSSDALVHSDTLTPSP